ncbi:MAG: ribosome maturation factor RimM [Lachnospiraceae bacterium]|nr:ribosome maturation factor RimM [Lachnospiraceae bacterium]
MTDRFQVGVITSTHGIRGEVKVYPTTDDVRRFKKLKTVTADTGHESLVLHIRSVKFFKQFVILSFDEYNDINEVGFLKKASLTIDRSDAVSLDKDEYFVADLIGLKCITDTGETLGEIKDVLETGANDVYVIRQADNSELLVPAIKDCILGVDMDEGVMRIHLLEGLI